jgi:hypothetical protein
VDIAAVLKSGEGVGKNLGIEFVELTPERVVADDKTVCVSRCTTTIVDAE